MVLQEHELSCPECGERMILKNSRFGLFYGCSSYPQCNGTHGAHPDGRPLGDPGDQATKAARMRAHKRFDKLWKGGRMSRAAAYRWLRECTRLPNHIGQMNIKQCEDLIKLVDWELKVPDRAGG